MHVPPRRTQGAMAKKLPATRQKIAFESKCAYDRACALRSAFNANVVNVSNDVQLPQ